MKVVNWLYEWLTSMPYLSFAIVWLTVYLINGKVRKATFAAMDVTAVVLAGAVAKQLTEWTNSSWGSVALFFVLLLYGGLLARRQDLLHNRIDLRLVLRWVCRTSFVVLAPLYLLLLVWV